MGRPRDDLSDAAGNPPYERSIDWDRFWSDRDHTAASEDSPAATYAVAPLLELLDARGPPGSFADVGCGAGAVPFTVAEAYPDVPVVGYDAAEPVLCANRSRAQVAGLSNLSFERTVLPAFAPDRSFDVVSSFFTLCYVEDVERALERLYDTVEPGGFLVFTYHNRLARSVFESIAAAPHEHLGEESAWNPATFEERFELVLEGDSLLSYERIHDVLGRWPRSVWSVVDTEQYGAWRQNPLVFVPK